MLGVGVGGASLHSPMNGLNGQDRNYVVRVSVEGAIVVRESV